MAQMVENLPITQRTRVWSLGQEDLLEKGMATPVFLPREPRHQRSLVGYSPWGAEVDTTEATNTFTFTK